MILEILQFEPFSRDVCLSFVEKKWHSCDACVGATTESGSLWITCFYMCQNLLKNEAYHNRYCCDSVRCKYMALYSVSLPICLEWEITIPTGIQKDISTVLMNNTCIYVPPWKDF